MKTERRIKCPCCGYPTLSEPSAYEICSLCEWEDDGQNDGNSHETLGGPNKDYSLREARDNFKVYKTMYRKSDGNFPTNPKYISLRKQLIEMYRKLEGSDRNDQLEEAIRDLERELVDFPKT